MIQSQKFHLYRNRHLFYEDDCIGKYDNRAPELVIHPDFEECLNQASSFLNRTTGRQVPARLAGEEPPAKVNLKPFPRDVQDLMDNRGDLTPELIIYARENFSEPDFERRYSGRVTWEEAKELIEEGKAESQEPFFTVPESVPTPPSPVEIDSSQVIYDKEEPVEDEDEEPVEEIA